MTGPVRLDGMETTLALGHLSAALARGLEPSQGPLTAAIRGFYARRFETRGADGGTPWAPLALATILRRQRAGLGVGLAPLIRTGALRNSLTRASQAFGIAALSADGQALSVGTRDPVTRFTEARRPVLPDEIPAAEVRSWVALIARSWGL